MAIVHRTARIRLRLTRRQADRCYGLLRAGGDVWAWILDSNRERADQGRPLVTEYQELCRELTIHGSVGVLPVTGARSVVQRYADACSEAAKRRSNGQRAGFPRRKRALIPVRFCNARFRVDGRRAGQVISFALRQRVGTLVVGDPKGITANEFGRVQNLRLRQWRRTHLMQTLCDKAARMGIIVRRVDERGTSSTCPACRRRTPKPQGRRFRCPHCMLEGHRDLVGAQNIAAVAGGRTRASLPVLVEHRRAGRAPARRDRRRHLLDRRRRGSCLASGLPAEPDGPSGRRSPVAERYPATGEDQAAPANEANVA